MDTTKKSNAKIKVVGNVRNGKQGGRVLSPEGLSPTIIATGYKDQVKIIERESNMLNSNKVNKIETLNGHQSGNVYDENGLSPTLCSTDWKAPVKIRTNTEKGYDEAYIGDGIRLDHPEGKTGRGRTQKDKTGALTCSGNWGTLDKDYSIRKLTPVECERLQGFPDNWTKYGKDDELISDTQRYKCCGNAVTTTVITAIVDEMFDGVEKNGV